MNKKQEKQEKEKTNENLEKNKENVENTENIEEKKTTNNKSEDIFSKKSFFKKVWFSIQKFEKYSEIAAEGFGSALKYLMKLIAIVAIISGLGSIYKANIEVRNIAKYVNNNLPELSYSNSTLNVNSEEPIIDADTEFGKIIIDTKTDSQEEINKYITDLKDEENAIVILKNNMILKQIGINGTASYQYKDLFDTMGVKEFDKKGLNEFLTGKQILPLYGNLFLVLFMSSFIIYLTNSLFNILAISIFGYLATIVLRMKIRYVAIFNMAVYSVTLSTILNAVYLIVNTFVDFEIKYFDLMYILIASIYMFAAIFILKSEFNKKQGEVQKIVKVEDEIKEELKEKEEKEEKGKQEKEKNEVKKPDKKEKKEEEKKTDKEKEDKKQNKKTGKKTKKENGENKLDNKGLNGEEPEGSNA